MDFYQPDEDQKLEDIIPDMTAPTPEQILESRELQRYINRTLATLPRVWRRAFALHYVEGVPVAEIARMTRHAESEVERHLEYAREYLRQRLREAGFEAPPHDQVVSDGLRDCGRCRSPRRLPQRRNREIQKT